ncbi:MAG: hypothetical protein PF961_20845 [Planctomycetota bacterium]|jgi:hypothetical protein|nr:hypothetical protein [Planctomycetota bacterium]
MRLPTIALLLLCLLPLSAAVDASTTAVVINAESEASVAIAARWMALRGIPEAQAIRLSAIPAGHRISLADFKGLILDPIEAALTERGLAERITCIAYAADFPTAIDLPKQDGLQSWQRGPGSLTALTLLAPLLGQTRSVITAPFANPYAERVEAPGAAADLAAGQDPRIQVAIELLQAKRYPEAIAALSELATDHAAPAVLYNLACAQALNDALDDAEASLAQAIQAGWYNRAHSEADGDFAALRERPSWVKLVAAMDAARIAIHPGPSLGFQQLPAVEGSSPGRLAMLLMPTRGRGLSLDQALSQIERSVASDGTEPTGTVYYMISKDQARTGPRRPLFDPAAASLRELGVEALVLPGRLPPAGSQVIGAMIGLAGFDWAKSEAHILPGAWCDHLTSTGGALQPKAGQAPFTVFLGAGAAGSGGAVSEPMNLALKFPSPFIHVHRARGLSLVEAVHRTIPCPYQYLAGGDPLSRPWRGQAAVDTKP